MTVKASRLCAGERLIRPGGGKRAGQCSVWDGAGPVGQSQLSVAVPTAWDGAGYAESGRPYPVRNAGKCLSARWRPLRGIRSRHGFCGWARRRIAARPSGCMGAWATGARPVPGRRLARVRGPRRSRCLPAAYRRSEPPRRSRPAGERARHVGPGSHRSRWAVAASWRASAGRHHRGGGPVSPGYRAVRGPAATGRTTPHRAIPRSAAPRRYGAIPGAAFRWRAIPRRHRAVTGAAIPRRYGAVPGAASPGRATLPGGRSGRHHLPPRDRLGQRVATPEGPDPRLSAHAGPAGPGLPARPVLRVEPAVGPRLMAGHERQRRRSGGGRSRTRILGPGYQRSIGGRDGHPDLGRDR